MTAALGGAGGARGLGRGLFPGGGAAGRVAAGRGEFPGFEGGAAGERPGRFGGPGGFGGFGGGGNATVSAAFARLLETGGAHYRWAAATNGADSAASMELATGGLPVMAIGGFRGTDPAPSLAEFEKLVSSHQIHYYVAGGAGGGFGGRGFGGFGGFGGGLRGAGGAPTDASQISAWVEAHFTARTVGGMTVYNLTAPITNS